MQFIYLAKAEMTLFRVSFVFVKILVASHKIQAWRKQPYSGKVKQVVYSVVLIMLLQGEGKYFLSLFLVCTGEKFLSYSSLL